MAVTKKDMQGKSGKNWSRSVDRHDRETWGKTSKKPESDDRPARTPRERNTGTTAAKRLAGKVIG